MRRALIDALSCLAAGAVWALALGGAWAQMGLATPAAAIELRRVPLGNPALASTEQGRADLKYLSYCSLDDRTVLVVEHEGRHYEFPGVVGLAPRWHNTELTLAEQHWVSACMLALSNHFGAKVEVSMHLPQVPNPTVKAAWMDLSRQYPMAEGRYFGNLFTADRRAYVCSAAADAALRQMFEDRQRVCALPGKERGDDGRPLTPCGLIHVGACSAGSFEQDGVRYQASIQVFLPASATAR